MPKEWREWKAGGRGDGRNKGQGGGAEEETWGEKASRCPGGSREKTTARVLYCTVPSKTHIQDFTSQEDMRVGGKTCMTAGGKGKITGCREASCPVNEREGERCQNEIKRL